MPDDMHDYTIDPNVRDSGGMGVTAPTQPLITLTPEEEAERSPLKCPNCGSQKLGSSASVSLEMIYDPEKNHWTPDIEGFDSFEAGKEAVQTFDDGNDEVLCGECDFEGSGLFFRTIILDQNVKDYIRERVTEFRALTQGRDA